MYAKIVKNNCRVKELKNLISLLIVINNAISKFGIRGNYCSFGVIRQSLSIF